MLIRTLNLERKAKKAFREDASDEEEPGMGYPKRFCEAWPELAAKNQILDESQDVQYMGGQAERNKRGNGRNKKNASCFDKLMSMSGSG
jgi:hypothetical protein